MPPNKPVRLSPKALRKSGIFLVIFRSTSFGRHQRRAKRNPPTPVVSYRLPTTIPSHSLQRGHFKPTIRSGTGPLVYDSQSVPAGEIGRLGAVETDGRDVVMVRIDVLTQGLRDTSLRGHDR